MAAGKRLMLKVAETRSSAYELGLKLVNITVTSLQSNSMA
jgi:hypothetical protein